MPSHATRCTERRCLSRSSTGEKERRKQLRNVFVLFFFLYEEEKRKKKEILNIHNIGENEEEALIKEDKRGGRR